MILKQDFCNKFCSNDGYSFLLDLLILTDLSVCYFWISNIKQCWGNLPVNTAIHIIKLSEYTGDCTFIFQLNYSHR